MKNARSVFVTALVLIGVVIGVGVWKGAIPPKFGTEGAIGAAKRYSSQQITDSDVRLGDGSIQSFIQSDLFHAIAISRRCSRAMPSRTGSRSTTCSTSSPTPARPAMASRTSVSWSPAPTSSR
jgi:hypothetical protein